MGSTTTFAERIARIETRAATGTATGFVTPGVVDETTPDRGKAPKMRKRRKSGGSYLGSVLGGVFASVTVLALGAAFVMADVDTAGLGDFASVLQVFEN